MDLRIIIAQDYIRKEEQDDKILTLQEVSRGAKRSRGHMRCVFRHGLTKNISLSEVSDFEQNWETLRGRLIQPNYSPQID